MIEVTDVALRQAAGEGWMRLLAYSPMLIKKK